MIPSVSNVVIEIEEQSSKTYMMDIEKKRISGYCDGKEAMKQVIFKILNTERYDYIIYSWNYGIEEKDLYGEAFEYICPELERRITEALTQDDRINTVDNFNFSFSNKNELLVKFVVHTLYGEVEVTTNV